MSDVFIGFAYTISVAIVLLGTTFLIWASLEFRATRGDDDYTNDVRWIVAVYAVNTIVLAITGYSHIIDYLRA